MTTRNWLRTLLVAVLTACSDGPVAVVVPEVSRVQVAPADRVLTVGDTMRLTAYPTAADGTVLGGVAVTWQSEDGDVASVRPGGMTGVVEAKAPGTVRISAQADGISGSVLVTVIVRPPPPPPPPPTPVAFVVVEPRTSSVWADHMVSFGPTSHALAASGLPLQGRSITFSVSDTTIAAVNAATGQVRGRRPGVVKVRATSEGKTGEAELHVFAVPMGSVTYGQTSNWWDGQVHVAEEMGQVTYTDDAGVQRTASLSLFGGSLTIDHGVYPYTYERVLVGEAYAPVNGTLRKVAERQFVDRGTVVVNAGPDGRPYMQFTSATTAALTYRGHARGHGEIVLRTDVGMGRLVDILFRQRP